MTNEIWVPMKESVIIADLKTQGIEVTNQIAFELRPVGGKPGFEKAKP